MMELLLCELVRRCLAYKEEDFMEKFLSPSTRLELLRFRNWGEWLAADSEGKCDAENEAVKVRAADRPDVAFGIAARQSRTRAPPAQCRGSERYSLPGP